MYVNFYTQEETIKSAIAAIGKFRELKLEEFFETDENNDITGLSAETVKLKTLVMQLQRDLDSSPRKPEPSEELIAIDKVIEEMQQDAKFTYSANRAEQIDRYARSIRAEKNKAYATASALVENLKNKIMALDFMAVQAIAGGTHKIKNSVLYVLRDSIKAIMNDLVGIDADDFYGYDVWDERASWDFRRLVNENAKLKSMVERLEKQNNGAAQDEVAAG